MEILGLKRGPKSVVPVFERMPHFGMIFLIDPTAHNFSRFMANPKRPAIRRKATAGTMEGELKSTELCPSCASLLLS